MQELLASLYSDDELRQMAGAAFAEPGMAAALPGPRASVLEVVYALVVQVEQRYAVPPESFWQHLVRTRGIRILEIDAVRGCFCVEPDPVASPASAAPVSAGQPASIRLVEPASGECDLIRVIGMARAQRAGPGPGPQWFEALVPGVINRMDRVLRIEWTPRTLIVAATPSLYRGAERLPARVERTVPVAETDLRYFPNGRMGYREGRPPPEIGVRVDAWDTEARRVVLVEEACAQVITVEFVAPGR